MGSCKGMSAPKLGIFRAFISTLLTVPADIYNYLFWYGGAVDYHLFSCSASQICIPLANSKLGT